MFRGDKTLKARILNIGDEVLTGATVNTNSSFLATQLFLLDIEVVDVRVIGDDKEAIIREINDFLTSEIDYLITTGGLGPTHDDFTKEVISESLGLELVEFKEASRHLKKYFPDDMPSCNNKQAFFPKASTILPNEFGSAFGNIINHNDQTLILLVGPPKELEPMFTSYVRPYLSKTHNIRHLTKELLIIGLGESNLEESLKDFYNKYPTIKMAPYANLGIIRFILVADKKDESILNEASLELASILKDNLIGDASFSLEEHLVNRLNKLRFKISFAESCTGGMLASRIVNVSGASKVFDESLVTYSDDAKNKYLQVDRKTLKTYGAVSEEVVIEMVEGLKKLTGSDVCVAVSGIAGPTGGTKTKPVGLVHYAIKIGRKVYSESHQFKGDRDMIRNKASVFIMWRILYYLNKL